MRHNGAVYSPEPDAPSIERRSVVAQVRDRLRRDITSGRLVADTLYSVTAVAAELGVSRTPVREALLQLAQLGLVQFHRNRGFTVTNVSADELIEIFQLRLAIETAAARRAATGATGTAELEAQLEAMATAAAEQDRPRFMVADRAFHECLLDIAGNRRAHDAVTVARDTLFSRGLSTSGEDRTWVDLVTEHREILAAVRRGDPAGAAAAMESHLVNTAVALVARLDPTPVPSDWADGWSGSVHG